MQVSIILLIVHFGFICQQNKMFPIDKAINRLSFECLTVIFYIKEKCKSTFFHAGGFSVCIPGREDPHTSDVLSSSRPVICVSILCFAKKI